jgi:hypothetical protein
MGPRSFRRLPAEITGPEAKMTLDNGAAEATPEDKSPEGGQDQHHDGQHHDGQDREVAREQWEELPRWQQTGILALAAVEVVLTTTAIVDLVRRPRAHVRGPKTLWFLGFAVQPFGPITYLALGRRRR